MMLFAHVVAFLSLLVDASPSGRKRATQEWQFIQNGTSGVIAIESIVVAPNLVVFMDRTQGNPLQIDGHFAWGALWNLETNTPTPLDLVSNTFCGSGAMLSNGSMVSVGGNPPGDMGAGDVDGLTAIRVFEPCDDPAGVGCTIFDNPDTLHMATSRWYTTAIRIFDGSLMIIGGTVTNTPFYNTQPVNTFEFFPPKDGGVPRFSPFLARSVPANLFPRAFQLPDGDIFIVANNQSILYNLETGEEKILPDLPNGVRVTNPFDGTGALLPLSPPLYIPEVLICGGTNISDSTPTIEISTQDPATTQCSRIKLTPEGIAEGWQVEHMINPRIMPEMVLLPNGQVLIINGGRTGVAAQQSAMLKDAADPNGQSNADHPVFTPELYTPDAPLGSRISDGGMPTTDIARMYHSTVTLTPNGNILVSGSSPNSPNTQLAKFPSEYRVETLNPPFMSVNRPTLVDPPKQIRFGETVSFSVTVPDELDASNVKVALIDLGFSTHAWHAGGRLVFLEHELSPDKKTLTITGPPNGRVFPPAPGWVFLTVDEVTGVAAKVMIGSGASPPTLE